MTFERGKTRLDLPAPASLFRGSKRKRSTSPSLRDGDLVYVMGKELSVTRKMGSNGTSHNKEIIRETFHEHTEAIRLSAIRKYLTENLDDQSLWLEVHPEVSGELKDKEWVLKFKIVSFELFTKIRPTSPLLKCNLSSGDKIHIKEGKVSFERSGKVLYCAIGGERKEEHDLNEFDCIGFVFEVSRKYGLQLEKIT